MRGLSVTKCGRNGANRANKTLLPGSAFCRVTWLCNCQSLGFMISVGAASLPCMCFMLYGHLAAPVLVTSVRQYALLISGLSFVACMLRDALGFVSMFVGFSSASQGRCRAGLQVQAERKGVLLPSNEQALPVENGDVITVFVLPDALIRDWSSDGGDPPGPSLPPGPSGSGGQDGDRTEAHTTPPAASVQPLAAGPVASTGGYGVCMPLSRHHVNPRHRGGSRCWVFGLVLSCLSRSTCATPDQVYNDSKPGNPQAVSLAVALSDGPSVGTHGHCQDHDNHSWLGRRALPTPCRAKRALISPEVHSPVGPTLLELAIEHSQGLAFWEACTLLEALFDHFEPKVSATHKARQLRLCGAVQVPQQGCGMRDVFILAGVHWQALDFPANPVHVGLRNTGPVLLGGLRMPFSFEDLYGLLDTPCTLTPPGEATQGHERSGCQEDP